MGRAKNGEGSITGPDKKGYYHFKVTTSVMNPNGTPYIVHTTSTVSGEDAKKRGLKRKREVERQEKISSKGKYTGKETFGFWLREYCEWKHTGTTSKKKWTDSTYSANMQLLEAHFFNRPNKLKSMQLHNLNQKAFQDYYDLLENEPYEASGKVLSLKKRQNIRGYMIRTIEFIERQGYEIDDNYAALAYVPIPTRDEVPVDYRGETEDDDLAIFSDEDIKKIWDGVQSNIFKYGYGYAIMLMTGIRSEELFGITNDLITISEDKKEGSIRICKAVGRRKNPETGKKEKYMKVTKNTDTRTVYLDELGVECVEKLRLAMKSHNNRAVNDKNLLIYDKEGNFVSLDVFNDEFHRFCVRFHVMLPDGKAAHMLRHTFITINNVRSSVNPIITAKVVGHRDLATNINVYTHPSEADVRKAIVNPLNITDKPEDLTDEQLQQFRTMYEQLKRIFEK